MKIICIGRNYLDHAKELSNKVLSEPIFFLKPDSAIQPKGHPFFIPDFSDNIHYEIELVIKICKNGKNINEKFANLYYNEIGLGIDFTARDLQSKLKEKGLPWDKAKAFDRAAVVGKFLAKSDFKDVDNINFRLEKNNKVQQTGNT